MPEDLAEGIDVVPPGKTPRANKGRHVPFYMHLLDNSPYMATGILGAWVLWQLHWSMGVIELIASILGPLWMVMTVCKHCSLYGKASCLAGYGLLSARLVTKGDPAKFHDMFVHHTIPVMPMYFLPVVGVVYMVIFNGYNIPWVLFIAFVIIAYVGVPLKARYITCAKCPKRADCPWGSRAAVRKKPKKGRGTRSQ
jgi:hypothetical protein